MKIAVVGITGLVGSVLNKVLEEYNLPITDFIPVASENSVGKKVNFRGKEYLICSIQDAIDQKPNIAIFSAGSDTSLMWAPKFAEIDCTVIDNSSAWRMMSGYKLIVPEVNAHILTKSDKIIANPNCSTIQMVVALAPLHKKYGIKRLVISTYQSFTGTGVKAVSQYEKEKMGISVPKEDMAYHYPIFENAIPQCDVFLDNLYTKEEMKLVNETKKILGDDAINITATAVRIPVNGGHSESINIELKSAFDLLEVKSLLENSSGVTVLDNTTTFSYPMPLYSKDKNEVFVGRIRRDDTVENGLNIWVVADNLRKGAATNAVQIAKYLQENALI